MSALKTSAAVLFFLLELCTYGAALWWSLTAFSPVLFKITAAVLSVGLLVGVWVAFGSPKAAMHLTGFARAGLLAVWFGAGAAALLGVGRPGLAAVFAGLVVVAGAADLAWA